MSVSHGGSGRVVVAGKLVVDEVLTCAHPVVPGSAQHAVGREIVGGGQVWHTARAARQAGASVAVTGWCSLDPESRSLRARLANAGVVDLLVPAGEAVRAVVLVGPDGERTIVATGGAARLPEDALDPDGLLDGTRWLHLDGYCLDDRAGAALVALARAAHDRDVPVSLEPASVVSLPRSTRWHAQLPELAAVLGRPAEIAAVEPLLSWAPGCTVAHDGPWPVRTVTVAGDVIDTPVPPVEIPTTGAGDRFAGGWLAVRLRGGSLAEAAAAGVLAAQRR